MRADPGIDLSRAAEHWGGDGFEAAFKAELEALGPERLGLHRCTSQGGMITGPITITLTARSADPEIIRLRVAVLFSETVGGCSCGDEPYQVPAAATLDVTIDRTTGQASIEPAASQTD